MFECVVPVITILPGFPRSPFRRESGSDVRSRSFRLVRAPLCNRFLRADGLPAHAILASPSTSSAVAFRRAHLPEHGRVRGLYLQG